MAWCSSGSDEGGECDICSKEDELSTCESCDHRYCLDCFGGECCTGKSLCKKCVYICKPCTKKSLSRCDAAVCEDCAFECLTCRDKHGKSLYFCKEHAEEHDGTCPGMSKDAARGAAAMHKIHSSAKALTAASARLDAAKAELQAATKAEAEARAAHLVATAALASVGSTPGTKRSAAAVAAEGTPALATRKLKSPPHGKLATKACRPSAPPSAASVPFVG
jgi:hypothetical protein